MGTHQGLFRPSWDRNRQCERASTATFWLNRGKLCIKLALFGKYKGRGQKASATEDPMPTDPMHQVVQHVVQHLRRTVLLSDGTGLTDGQLLECFISHRDDAAFAALVHRHGGMVWAVCRRLLQNHHDAEDAFQATFLVLVRRAASIVPREMLPNWLYGVAHQTALKARATAAKRKKREQQVVDMPEPEMAEQGGGHDFQDLLDQEFSRLSDKYRVAIVLCDLEGKTNKEAAHLLGWPEGTVRGRLSRGRKILARRLTRHGLVLSGGTLAVLSQSAASGSVPSLVVSSTIKAADLVAAGQATAGVIAVPVAALAEGVIRAMFLSKLKTVAVVLLFVSLLGSGVGVVSYRTLAAKFDDFTTSQLHTTPLLFDWLG